MANDVFRSKFASRRYLSADNGKTSPGLNTCYNAAYRSQIRDQQCFAMSEEAADWHELMVPQRVVRPSIARAKSQTPLHGHRLRTPPTDKNLPHPNILTYRDVGLWHCDVANLL